jgi:hypothetical protein
MSIEKIRHILDDIRFTESQGGDKIGIEPLKSNLLSLEEYLKNNDSQMEHEKEIEMFRSGITAGQSALKAAMIVNGGAIVTLVTFIGNIWNSGKFEIAAFSCPFALFCYGVILSAVAFGTTYLSQFFFNESEHTLGKTINFITISLVTSSYLSFGYGTYKIYTILSSII